MVFIKCGPYTQQSYLAIKKNKILQFTGKWMELEIMLNEIKQTKESQTLHVFSHIWNPHLKNKNNMSVKYGDCLGVETSGMREDEVWRVNMIQVLHRQYMKTE
jgi:hypothetical protein